MRPLRLLLLLLPLAGALRAALAPRRAPAPRASLSPPPTSGAIAWFGEQLERTRTVRCPFWRTRASDALDASLQIFNFVAARHKSILDRQWLPGSEASLFEPLQLPVPTMGEKTPELTLEAVMDVVRRDFEAGQYYVSGRLSQAVYDDACFFDSPDPDMPVKSLQRYSDALKGLFDPGLSSIELVDMEPVGERRFVAHWRLSGALKLPGRPHIKPYAGATLYELDEQMLIVSHTETWSISVLDAFVSTVWPNFGAPAAPSAEHHAYVAPPSPRL